MHSYRKNPQGLQTIVRDLSNAIQNIIQISHRIHIPIPWIMKYMYDLSNPCYFHYFKTLFGLHKVLFTKPSKNCTAKASNYGIAFKV